jgi:hypothetical protein
MDSKWRRLAVAVSANLSAEGTVTAFAGVATVGATAADPVTVSAGASVRARPIDIVLLVILLLWLIALVLPLVETELTPKEHQILSDYLTVVSIAFPVHLVLREYRKR